MGVGPTQLLPGRVVQVQVQVQVQHLGGRGRVRRGGEGRWELLRDTALGRGGYRGNMANIQAPAQPKWTFADP